MNDTQPTSPRSKLWLWIAGGIFLGAAAGVILLAFTGAGAALFSSREINALAPAVPQIDSPAPGFSLVNLRGETISLSELRGRRVVLNFWATWCGPCRQEMPVLQAAQDRYPGELLILAINNAEPVGSVQTFIDELGLGLEILLDPGAQVTERYRVRGFPTTIFIDENGMMRYQHIGVLNESLLAGYLQDLGVGE